MSESSKNKDTYRGDDISIKRTNGEVDGFRYYIMEVSCESPYLEWFWDYVVETQNVFGTQHQPTRTSNGIRVITTVWAESLIDALLGHPPTGVWFDGEGSQYPARKSIEETSFWLEHIHKWSNLWREVEVAKHEEEINYKGIVSDNDSDNDIDKPAADHC
jgi:hypothetical protein